MELTEEARRHRALGHVMHWTGVGDIELQSGKHKSGKDEAIGTLI